MLLIDDLLLRIIIEKGLLPIWKAPSDLLDVLGHLCLFLELLPILHSHLQLQLVWLLLDLHEALSILIVWVGRLLVRELVVVDICVLNSMVLLLLIGLTVLLDQLMSWVVLHLEQPLLVDLLVLALVPLASQLLGLRLLLLVVHLRLIARECAVWFAVSWVVKYVCLFIIVR